MTNAIAGLADSAWPLTLLLAWLVGEYAWQRLHWPRIGAYALVGFLLAPAQLGFLPQPQSPHVMLLAHLAFGLMLFDCGYRIDLRWLRANPWLAASGVLESALCLGAVYGLLRWLGQDSHSALTLAALAMATSPASIVRLVRESRSAGQATERLLYLASFSTVLAVLAFRIILGWAVLSTASNPWAAAFGGLAVLLASVLLGLLAAVLTPLALRLLQRGGQDSTLAFALAVICLVALALGLGLSPVLATLAFGLWARQRRLVLNATQRGFGTLGDLFSVLLFVFIAASLDWQQVYAGLLPGLALVIARLGAKLLGNSVLAHASGISWRKGVYIGLGSLPTPALVILVLEQTRLQGQLLTEQLLPLATATLVLELLGPPLVLRALVLAREAPDYREA